jgi:hypothetical protein
MSGKAWMSSRISWIKNDILNNMPAAYMPLLGERGILQPRMEDQSINIQSLLPVAAILAH